MTQVAWLLMGLGLAGVIMILASFIAGPNRVTTEKAAARAFGCNLSVALFVGVVLFLVNNVAISWK